MNSGELFVETWSLPPHAHALFFFFRFVCSAAFTRKSAHLHNRMLHATSLSQGTACFLSTNYYFGSFCWEEWGSAAPTTSSLLNSTDLSGFWFNDTCVWAINIQEGDRVPIFGTITFVAKGMKMNAVHCVRGASLCMCLDPGPLSCDIPSLP